MKKIVIVTGGVSGIGRSTCNIFVRNGFHVVAVDISSVTEGGFDSFQECEKNSIDFCEIDISDANSVLKFSKQLIEKYGHIDVLVNNAAIMKFSRVVDTDVSDWDRVIGVNLRGMFLMCKYFIPILKNGVIINIGSVHGTRTTANVASYATSKAGIEAFTRALSIECKEENIRVVCIAPGSVDTPMLRNNPNIKSGVEILSGEIAHPNDIADVIYFFSSDSARAVTGSCVVVDNGLLSRI